MRTPKALNLLPDNQPEKGSDFLPCGHHRSCLIRPDPVEVALEGTIFDPYCGYCSAMATLRSAREYAAEEQARACYFTRQNAFRECAEHARRLGCEGVQQVLLNVAKKEAEERK